MQELDWDELARTERPVMYRYAQNLVKDVDIALDLIQETFAKAYKARHTYRPGTNPRAWLMTILKNSCMDHFRRLKRHPSEVLWDFQGPYAEEIESSPVWSAEEAFLEHYISEDLIKALKKVNPVFRQTLMMEFFGGLTPTDIARELNIPTGTANTRKFRGLKQLREALAA